MAFDIKKKGSYLILEYRPYNQDIEWVYEKIKDDEEIGIVSRSFYSDKKIFYFLKKDVFGDKKDGDACIKFILAKLEKDYYKIDGRIFSIKNNVFIYKDVNISKKTFSSTKNISIFYKIGNFLKNNIYIGGNNENKISIEDFHRLINGFPGDYELNKYLDARISVVLENFFDSYSIVSKKDSYEKYLNKKISLQGDNLSKKFLKIEIEKYKDILEKLNRMINSEIKYNEKQWQEEILQIILFIYPKYIKSLKEVTINTTDCDGHKKKKRIDLLLIDSSGYIDIIEIKKPFDGSVLSSSIYRGNFVPHKELTGSIMQTEKYLFYLNKISGGENARLTNKYKKYLPSDLNINIINPSGIIIIGRSNNFNKKQSEDFEIIRRKYKNIVDIITYDDLINRVNNIIKSLEITVSM